LLTRRADATDILLDGDQDSAVDRRGRPANQASGVFHHVSGRRLVKPPYNGWGRAPFGLRQAPKLRRALGWEAANNETFDFEDLRQAGGVHFT
jgi:hypothetical protein